MPASVKRFNKENINLVAVISWYATSPVTTDFKFYFPLGTSSVRYSVKFKFILSTREKVQITAYPTKMDCELYG